MPIDPRAPLADELGRLFGANLGRYLRQNGLSALPAGESAALVARLRAIVGERGLPRPLDPGESGEPGEIPEEECRTLVNRILAEAPPSACEGLATPVRQLVKACLNPEFADCRNSYREVSPDGSCRRQELPRTRKRISGAHCVDCPHWTALEPAAHARFLAAAWRADRREEFAAHRDVFLPEDFRALRRALAKIRRAPV